MSELKSSEILLAKLRTELEEDIAGLVRVPVLASMRNAAEDCLRMRIIAEIMPEEFLALVECVESAAAWRDASDEDDEESKKRLLDAIRAVESL